MRTVEAGARSAFGDAVAGLPGVPDAWRGWPTAIDVAFTLTPTTCVHEALYREYERASLVEAARTLFDPGNREIFVHYRLHRVGPVPAVGWYASWPLLRRGRYTGIVPREARQGAAPWDREPDDTLLEIWNQPRGVYGTRRTLMLRVGGRSPDDAARNWAALAKPLRRLFREVQADAAGRGEELGSGVPDGPVAGGA